MWAAAVTGIILLVVASVWLVFFLSEEPFDVATLSPSAGDSQTVTIGEVEVSTPAAAVGSREVVNVDFSLPMRALAVTITYAYAEEAHDVDPLTDSSTAGPPLPSPLTRDDIDAYVQHLASQESFWLIYQNIDQQENPPRVVLLEIVEHQGLFSIVIEEEPEGIVITYMLRSFGFLNVPFERAAAVNDFLGDFGLGADEVLMDHGGIGRESIEAYVQTAAELVEGMTYEDAREFNRELWSFIWSLIILTFSTLTPFALYTAIRLIIRIRRDVIRAKENIPLWRTQYKEALERVKEWWRSLTSGEIGITEITEQLKGWLQNLISDEADADSEAPEPDSEPADEAPSKGEYHAGD